MDVRAATDVEVDRLATIWHQGWQDAHAEILPAEIRRFRTLESFRERLRASLAGTRVVGAAGAPDGFCITKGDELHQLYVAGEARGSGAAAALIDDAEARLAAGGVATAWLACAVGNLRAARFYEKRGWRRAGVGLVDDGAGEATFPVDVWRYEKDLVR
jgi:ribosomal protein S18 acetylase RimI-like enzyme